MNVNAHHQDERMKSEEDPSVQGEVKPISPKRTCKIRAYFQIIIILNQPILSKTNQQPHITITLRRRKYYASIQDKQTGD